MVKKLLLITALMPFVTVAEIGKAASSAAGAPKLNAAKLKQDFQGAKQKIKEAEQKYHKSVQDTEDAKKNNLSKDEVTRREQAQEKAKQELEAAKK